MRPEVQTQQVQHADVDAEHQGAENGTALTIRPATLTDVDACGRIVHEAFTAVDNRLGFPSWFPTVEDGVRVARARISHPSVFGLVADEAGQILGSAFLSEGDPIRGVGPITVDPGIYGRGLGRQLMHALLERGRGSISI